MATTAVLILMLIAAHASISLSDAEIWKRQVPREWYQSDWSDSSESEFDENDIDQGSFKSVEDQTDLTAKRGNGYNCNVCVTSKDERGFVTHCGSIDKDITCHPTGDEITPKGRFSKYCTPTKTLDHEMECLEKQIAAVKKHQLEQKHHSKYISRSL